jgi:D-lactate dehydrogenase (cytochrome)
VGGAARGLLRGLALRPGAKGLATDVCVPISRLAECILETKKDIRGVRLIAPMVGHVGDGNFHLVYVIDPDDPSRDRRCAYDRVMVNMRALAMDGTCTGEHGIGLRQDGLPARPSMARRSAMMRAIKHGARPA